MPVQESDIRARLTALSPTELTITDTSSGCGTSFTIAITSPLFAEKSRLQRHRLVHSTLGADLISKIHALDLKLVPSTALPDVAPGPAGVSQ